MDKPAERLKEKGVKPSYLRVRILEYMLKYRNHPTVDMIYQALSPEIPTLSRTSVYNTVKLFLENGIVQKIGIDDQEMRYDADTKVHAHFKCEGCGTIIDLPVTPGAFPAKLPEGLKINDIQYYLRGLCQKCGEKPLS
jgi:Fe2+ or Zn2+ uptake regulation protein